jgi:hypothetical protein
LRMLRLMPVVLVAVMQVHRNACSTMLMMWSMRLQKDGSASVKSLYDLQWDTVWHDQVWRKFVRGKSRLGWLSRGQVPSPK